MPGNDWPGCSGRSCRCWRRGTRSGFPGWTARRSPGAHTRSSRLPSLASCLATSVSAWLAWAGRWEAWRTTGRPCACSCERWRAWRIAAGCCWRRFSRYPPQALAGVPRRRPAWRFPWACGRSRNCTWARRTTADASGCCNCSGRTWRLRACSATRA
ncbi:Uncharacterised protein [Acinetobacter baumannii]|nr:Uncharacterised protein [Acinetobacter baumannii]